MRRSADSRACGVPAQVARLGHPGPIDQGAADFPREAEERQRHRFAASVDDSGPERNLSGLFIHPGLHSSYSAGIFRHSCFSLEGALVCTMAERLLIVEDEDTLCASLQRVFRAAGYDVDRANSAEEAFQLLADRSYDLIVTDIILPGISGIDLLLQYRKTNPLQKVMVMTAYASLSTAVEAIKAGACDFIIKPLMHDEMKLAVRRALDKPCA